MIKENIQRYIISEKDMHHLVDIYIDMYGYQNPEITLFLISVSEKTKRMIHLDKMSKCFKKKILEIVNDFDYHYNWGVIHD